MTDDIYQDRYAHRTCRTCNSCPILKPWKLLGIDPAQLGLFLRGAPNNQRPRDYTFHQKYSLGYLLSNLHFHQHLYGLDDENLQKRC